MERGAAFVLIGAYDPAVAPGGLRGLLPLAGSSLIEHQARRSVAAGAERVLLLVDEVPPELAEVVGRLRHDGIGTALCEGIGRVADALMPEDRVLLLADACLPDEPLLQAALGQPAPAIAVLADTSDHAGFERVDADWRWAGVSLIDGRHVAETAAMLGSWDPVSTLLRRAVQQGAPRIDAGTTPILASDPAALADAERRIVAATREPADDWVGRTLFAPAEEFALPLLLARRIETRVAAAVAGGLGLFGGAIACAGWRWPALLLLLLSGPVAAGAARLARVRDQHNATLPWLHRCRVIGLGLAVLGLGWTLQRTTGEWGWIVLAALVMGARAARLPISPAPAWLASSDGLVWAVVPFALIGRWDFALAAAAGYALLSFAFAQWQALRDS
jgi:hypothetical protein